jgi:hypothetical protein
MRKKSSEGSKNEFTLRKPSHSLVVLECPSQHRTLALRVGFLMVGEDPTTRCRFISTERRRRPGEYILEKFGTVESEFGRRAEKSGPAEYLYWRGRRSKLWPGGGEADDVLVCFRAARAWALFSVHGRDAFPPSDIIRWCLAVQLNRSEGRWEITRSAIGNCWSLFLGGSWEYLWHRH